MKSNKTIWGFLALVLLIAAVFLIYRFWLAPTAAPADNLVGLESAGFSAGDVAVNAPPDDFLNLLLSLRAINLNNAKTIAARLTALADFSVALQAQTPGRSNPFLAIGNNQPF